MDTNKKPVDTKIDAKAKPAKRKPLIIQLTDEEVTDVVGGTVGSSRCPPGAVQY